MHIRQVSQVRKKTFVLLLLYCLIVILVGVAIFGYLTAFLVRDRLLFFFIAFSGLGVLLLKSGAIVRDISERKKTKAPLRQEKQLSDDIINSLPGVFYILDDQGCLVRWNSQFSEITGYSAKELDGQHALNFIIASDHQLIAERIAKVFTTGAAVAEALLQTKDKRTIPYYFSGKRVVLEDKDYMSGLGIDISERKQAEDALRAAEERWKFALEGTGDGVWDWNLQTGEVYFSKRCKEILGYDHEDGDKRFAAWESTIHPDDFSRMMEELQAHLKGKTGCYFNEHRVRSTGGGWKWLLTRGKVVERDANGKALRMIGTQSDISERKEAEESLRLAALVFENSSEGVTITDADGVILAVNPAFTELTGYTAEEVVGKNPRLLSSGRQDAAFYQAMWRQLINSGHWAGEIWNRRKDGELYAEWLSINTSFNPDGSVHRRVGLFSDITKRKKSEELIWRQANYDFLTNLPNRRMFRDRLEQAIKKAHRANLSVALMFIDLDHFKQVNDTLGHDMGDVLLKEATQRLSRCVRNTDTVARLGGDEFAVILDELDDPKIAERVAQNILQNLAEPFTLGREQAYISASIGVSFYPKDAAEIDELLKDADQAMYAAKDHGRNCHRYFAQSMQEAAQNRMQLTTDMRHALTEDQFLVYYQPIVELKSGRLIKAEALIRWQHPTRGLVNPVDFIPFAEDSGLIVGIGRWVLQTACAQTMAWRAQGLALPQITVNVSARQFYEGNFQDVVREILDETRLPPEDLELEITEGMLMHDMEQAVSTVQALWKVGVHISEDDFGTGYSSLNYLKRFPIHTLKIDKSFVRDIGRNADDTALVAAIIAMAHSLHLTVVAEGVETEQQLDFLRQQGCNHCQGFWFAKPMPAQEFAAYLAASKGFLL